MDTLGQILLFKDIVDSGGFSKAAIRRSLSHSTVSKQLKALEAELGVRLLHRTSRTMSLTEAGSTVLDFGRRMSASEAELRERLMVLRGEVVGELKINSLVHIGTHIVQPAVRIFLARFPSTRVALKLDDGPLHFTRDGYDLAFRVGLPSEGSLVASKILDNEVCIVAAPSLLERLGPLEHPSQLAHAPTVAYQASDYNISAWNYFEDQQVHTVEVHPRYRMNDGNALVSAVLSGIGIGYLSEFAAAEHLDAGRLVRVLPKYRCPPFAPVFLIQAALDHPSTRIESFRSCLREALEQKGLVRP